MRASTAFAFLSSAALALAQSGANPFNVPPGGYNNIAAGNTVPLTWSPTTGGTVSLVLRNGPSNNLNQGTPIASNIPNDGSFSWTVPSSIVQGDNYAVEIVADGNPGETNFTPQFSIASSNTQSSSASSSMTSTASSSTASSTSMTSSTSTSTTMTTSMSSVSSVSSMSTTASSPTMSSATVTATPSSPANSGANRIGHVFGSSAALSGLVLGLAGVATGMMLL